MGRSQSKVELNHGYGWIRGKADPTDQYHDFTEEKKNLKLNVVKKVDLREFCPPVYDQGKLGSCTANAIAFLYEYDMIKQFRANASATIPFTPARNFIYYNEREMEGTTSEDAGAEIRDGIKSINMFGVCSETLYPYDISKFTEKPPAVCYKHAEKHKAVAYKRVNQNLEDMKQCLVSGYPFAFGFEVFESFETVKVATTGEMVLPADEGDKLLGGHAVAAVGYDDEKEVFIIRNSWSDKWGDKGYFYMPYSFITNSARTDDFWTVYQTANKEDI